jgi:predicted DNA-binding transcriptional regulator AlpA
MPTTLKGTSYLHLAELADEVGVTRQTLWRWRKEGSIPQGNRFRGRKILFNPAEVEAVREFAFRVEPIYEEQHESAQVSLFDRDP